MRAIDADRLKRELRQSNDCENCAYNGQRHCRTSCHVNEFADLIDNQESISDKEGDR